jgi:phage-related tail protein
LKNQDETNDQFCHKELLLENQINSLTNELKSATEEVSVKERQMKKHEAKLQAEEAKYFELQNELDMVLRDKNQAIEAKEAIHSTYDD